MSSAESLAKRVYEFSEFVVDVLGVTDLGPYLDRDKAGSPRTVTYHETCHLRRELGATTQPRALIRSLEGVSLLEMEQSEVCGGFGGTFAVKYSDISGAMLQDKLDNIRGHRRRGGGCVRQQLPDANRGRHGAPGREHAPAAPGAADR